MKTKYIRFFAIVAGLVFILSGCTQLRDVQLVRKKEVKKGPPRYYAVHEYDVHPNLELYTKRYIFWKNWHRELLDVLGDENRKKAIVAIEQEVSNLMDMRDMLVDEKADELQKLIDKASKVEAVIKKQKVTVANEVRIRKQMELVGKKVKKGFSYRKIQGYIRSDFKE